MGLWKRKILYLVSLWQYQRVLPLAATAVPLPPGSTSCSILSASLPGAAAWPTPLHQLVAAATTRPRCSAFPLHLLQFMTGPPLVRVRAAERAVPRAGGARGGRGVSRMPPLWRATRHSPSHLLTMRSWSAPSAASASLRPKRTSLGHLSTQAQEEEQGMKPELDLHSVPGSDLS